MVVDPSIRIFLIIEKWIRPAIKNRIQVLNYYHFFFSKLYHSFFPKSEDKDPLLLIFLNFFCFFIRGISGMTLFIDDVCGSCAWFANKMFSALVFDVMQF